MYGDISNTREFDKESIDEELVYSYYLGYQISLTKSFISPFTINGRTEKTPSFKFFIKNNKIKFRCFSSGVSGDCIDLVKRMYGLSYGDSLDKIKRDLYYSTSIDSIRMQNINVPANELIQIGRDEKKSSKIEVVTREFNSLDIGYWIQSGLTLDDLKEFDVKACEEVWLEDRIWYEYREKDPCYRYRISDQYKVYCPLRKGRGKWLSNATKKNVQGLRFLPEKGEFLVITKSYKDIMVLKKYFNVCSIALSSESSKFTTEMVDYFYSRFDNIVIFYDNDEPGIRHGMETSKETGIPFVYIPIIYKKATDPADLYREYGEAVFTEVIKQLLKI